MAETSEPSSEQLSNRRVSVTINETPTMWMVDEYDETKQRSLEIRTSRANVMTPTPPEPSSRKSSFIGDLPNLDINSRRRSSCRKPSQASILSNRSSRSRNSIHDSLNTSSPRTNSSRKSLMPSMIPENDDVDSVTSTQFDAQRRRGSSKIGILADTTHSTGNNLKAIRRGSIVMTNDKHGRRLSTFSNLPIETRFADEKGLDNLMHQIQVQYENTYSLEPAKGVPNTDKLRKILKNLISNELSDFSGRYSSFTAKYYCRIVADLIKNEVKDRVDTRYKIITYVHIGENNGQDLSIKSSFLWDAERDRHVDFSLKIDNKESGDTRTGMFLVAKVFFLYYD